MVWGSVAAAGRRFHLDGSGKEGVLVYSDWRWAGIVSVDLW